MSEEKKIREIRREYELRIKNLELRIKNLEEQYNLVIKSKDEQIEIYKDEIKFLREVVKQNADKPVKFINENKIISEIETIKKNTDQSRNINITGGKVNASGAGAFNLGEISDTVANTINQLPTSPDPDNPGIKELLSQLQKAIEAETSLDDVDKGDALEEVQNLAQASQDQDQNAKKTNAGKSLRMLGRIVKGLPATAALMNICKELLPAISQLFNS